MKSYPNNHIRDNTILPIGGLSIVLLISLLLLIFTNYYTLRTMSAMRAYIYGESAYSKGEKNASQNLMLYINTHDSVEWNDYLQNIAIPDGDRKAREALLNDLPMAEVREGFLQGENHPQDIDQMIWLFNTFKNSPLMRAPIGNWERGDSLIQQKHLIALQIKTAVDEGTIELRKNELLSALKENMNQLTLEERNFSTSLGKTARLITDYLFLANLLFILVIVGSVTFYIFNLLRKLNQRNRDLTNANNELDRLVYTISHDLRSPINSLLGLVGLAERETKVEQIGIYLKMMNQALRKQETFVKETIEMSRENRTEIKREIVDLSQLIDQVISMHRHMPDASGIRFSTEIGVYRIFTDRHKLEIILRNLISNAIKYHDPEKNDKYIKVSTFSEFDKIHIDVTDNGIGIKPEDQEKVFSMFYMATSHDKGSGLGLYIVNEMTKKLGGGVFVKSSEEGSTFSVVLNK